jgi:hypothetical protein
MTVRRHAKGTPVLIPISTIAEYEQAVIVLERLQKAPLGTDQTEGLQDLIEAILDFEEVHPPGNGRDRG